MKIALVTGSRSEFYLLKGLILRLQKNKKFKLNLIVTGSHLSKFFGSTIHDIKKEKIRVNDKVNISIKGDREKDIAKSISIGVKSFSKKFNKFKPDLLIILGDRYEIYSAAIAACINKIPIAHIHGGEKTKGLIDEGIRHSITKHSHLHFVSTKTYFKRVQQLGENKKNIFNVGSLGVEAIKKEKLYLKKKIEKILKIRFDKKNILVTFHPETLENRRTNKNNFIKLLKALKKLKNTTIIFTMPNADVDFKTILKEIKKFVSSRKNAFFFKSLGHKKYFTLCKNVDLMIGNSSSGIIEMPSFRKATVNIGDRQGGRVRAQSVIDVDNNTNKILKSISYSYSKKFKKVLQKVKNPYDGENTSYKILKILQKIKLKNIIKKSFFDYKIQ